MRIGYVVLTCQKYAETRVAWQRETCLSSVASEDIVYLGHQMDAVRRLFSWGAGDDYHSLPYKFVDFFRYYVPQEGQEWDWYVFIDDDTYVQVDRLRALLAFRDPSVPWAEGHLLTHIAHTEWGIYHSGGAGTVLSRVAVEALSRRMRERAALGEYRTPHWCAAICLGLWLKELGVRRIHHDGFHPEGYRAGVDDPSTAITFHHLKTREEFQWYQGLIGSLEN